MRIVHLLRYYAPAWGYGGVVRAAYGLTTALAALGHEVIVVTTDAGDPGQRLQPRESVVEGVQVWRCPNVSPALLKFNLSSPRGMRGVLRHALTGADVLHVHELRTVENLLGLPLAREMGISTVLSPHGTLAYEAGRSGLKRGWDAMLGARLARQIDRVAALTADEAQDVRALWERLGLPLRPDQIRVVPNGIDPAEYEEPGPRGLFRARFGIPSDQPLLLFLGRLHVRKGAQHAIAALAHLPGAWLAVVGPDEGQAAALRAQADQFGVAGRVVFTGLLTGPDKQAALHDADILVLPAVGEGLPMVALEAMASRLPVALSPGCHLPEAAAAGAGVVLDGLDGRAIADVLGPLLADSDLRRAMGDRGRRLVLGRFTWDSVAKQAIGVYQTAG